MIIDDENDTASGEIRLPYFILEIPGTYTRFFIFDCSYFALMKVQNCRVLSYCRVPGFVKPRQDRFPVCVE